jgi:hypothetical protein
VVGNVITYTELRQTLVTSKRGMAPSRRGRGEGHIELDGEPVILLLLDRGLPLITEAEQRQAVDPSI